MPKIATYPVVTPTADDLLIGTNGTDGVTKNFTAGSVGDLAIAGHVAAADPHPGYTTQAELDAALLNYLLSSTFTAHAALTTTAHGGIVASSDSRLTDARTPLAHNQGWSTITTTPTTLSGYGISDAFTQALADARYRPIAYTPSAADIPNPLNAHGIRTAVGSNAAGLYVPWITGDALTAAYFGATTAGNNQVALTATSNSNSGAVISSVSGIALTATSTSSIAILATNGSSSCVIATNFDTATNTAPFGLNLRHGTSGVPAAGFGESLAWQIQDAGNTYRTAATILAVWTDPLAVSFTSALTFATANAAGAQAERMRLTGVGALWLGITSGGLTGAGDMSINGKLQVAGNVGFNGASAAAKPTVAGSRGGNAALADLLTKLASYGLITDGTSA